MKGTLGKRLGAGLLLILGLVLLALAAEAMPSAEQELYLRMRHVVEELIADANQIAAHGIAIAEETTSHAVFDNVIQGTNSFMSAFIRDLQPALCLLTFLSGQQHALVCTYVQVYNRHLNRTAWVDPIHLTSSGD